MEPEPPPITLADPPAATGAADLLAQGSEKDPWRPSPTLVRRTVATALAGTLLVGAVVVVGDAVLDRSARNGVRLEADSTARHGDPLSTTLVIRSTGSEPVTVQSVRLLGEGYGELSSGLEVRAGHAAEVALAPGLSCPADPFAPGPRRAVVTVRTHRGELVRRTVSLDETLAQRFEASERVRCGVLGLVDSISTALVDHRVTSTGVAVTFGFFNHATVPVTLRDWSGTDGLQLERLPGSVLVPAGDGTGSLGEAVQVVLHLRVASCSAWRAAPRGGQVPGAGEPGAEVPFGAGRLAAFTLARQDGQVVRFLYDEPSEVHFYQPRRSTLVEALERHC